MGFPWGPMTANFEERASITTHSIKKELVINQVLLCLNLVSFPVLSKIGATPGGALPSILLRFSLAAILPHDLKDFDFHKVLKDSYN